MLDKRFEKELKMIENALQTERGKNDFKEYTRPLVEDIVDKFAATDRGKKEPQEKLIEAGWIHFDLALKKYKDRANSMLAGKSKSFYFSAYYNWYIRQGIVEYLKSKGNN